MIVPGIFEKDFEEVKRKLRLVEQVAPLVQIDIADGILVDGKTFLTTEKLNEIETKTKLELHLMVTNPTNYVTKINNVKNIYAQVEGQGITEFITQCKTLGYKTGLSLNPETPLAVLEPLINHIDLVQFMTVIPGGQGRTLETDVLIKIKEFKEKHPQIPAQADGGFNEATVDLFAKAGLDTVEAGSAIFGKENPAETYTYLNNLFKEAKIQKDD